MSSWFVRRVQAATSAGLCTTNIHIIDGGGCASKKRSERIELDPESAPWLWYSKLLLELSEAIDWSRKFYIHTIHACMHACTAYMQPSNSAWGGGGGEAEERFSYFVAMTPKGQKMENTKRENPMTSTTDSTSVR